MYIIPLKDKPKTCINCPCCLTLANIPSDTDTIFCARVCSATANDLIVLPQIYPLPDTWMEFPIPDFCPIKEI